MNSKSSKTKTVSAKPTSERRRTMKNNCGSKEIKQIVANINNAKINNFLGMFRKNGNVKSIIEELSDDDIDCVINNNGDTLLILAMKKYKKMISTNLRRKTKENIIIPLLNRVNSYKQISDHLKNTKTKDIRYIKETIHIILETAIVLLDQEALNQTDKDVIITTINDLLKYNDSEILYSMINNEYDTDCLPLIKKLKEKNDEKKNGEKIISIDKLLSSVFTYDDALFIMEVNDCNEIDLFKRFFDIHTLVGEKDKKHIDIKISYGGKAYDDYGGKSNFQNMLIQVFIDNVDRMELNNPKCKYGKLNNFLHDQYQHLM